ncbi:MAG: PilZ domain-containing protein [Pseudolabrys sp.]
MNEKHVAPRHHVLKSAFIVISEKAPKLECTVKNISDGGAALRVSTTIGIPKNFDLIIDGKRHHCHWVD